MKFVLLLTLLTHTLISETWISKSTLGNLSYTFEAGEETVSIDGTEKATIFYTAYFVVGKDRPITLCFNGGPGSSAIWLHMGAFGPKKVSIKTNGDNSPPYQIEDNPESILAYTDLVFIDPISTGFSRVKNGDDPKLYHNVDEDVKLLSEFVRGFITNKGRWNSPKYLAGESYGAARVIGMADHLEEKRLYFNGLILISAATNTSFIRAGQPGNDLPYILFLPSYTASAFYHKKIDFKSLDEALNASKDFAENEYVRALMKGDGISPVEKRAIAEKLSQLTGLATDWILASNIRIAPMRFAKELLKKEGLIIGRFDSRFEGKSTDINGSVMEFDYTHEAIFPSFVAGFNQHMKEAFQWDRKDEYVFLTNLQPWNFCTNGQDPMNMGTALRELIIRNRGFRVFLGVGLYDLATPFFSQEYIIDHLGLDDKSQIQVHTYPAGHMMYIDETSMKALHNDLKTFFQGDKK